MKRLPSTPEYQALFHPPKDASETFYVQTGRRFLRRLFYKNLIFFYQYLNNWFAIPLIYGILKDFVNFLAEGGQINEDDLRSTGNVRLYLTTPWLLNQCKPWSGWRRQTGYWYRHIILIRQNILVVSTQKLISAGRQFLRRLFLCRNYSIPKLRKNHKLYSRKRFSKLRQCITQPLSSREKRCLVRHQKTR